MKNFDRFIITVSAMIFLAAVIMNLVLFSTEKNDSKPYRVEINRIEQEIADGKEINADSYDTILGIYQYNSDGNFYNSKNEYVIREINGTLYRIEYDKISDNNLKFKLTVNILSGILLLSVLSILCISEKIS